MNEDSFKKWFFYAGYAVYAILAIVFFVERATYVDGGFIIFRLINSGRIIIEHSRYSGALFQILPLFALKAGFSLKWILITSSFSFPLIYFLLSLFCFKVMKDIDSAISILIINIVATSHSFFWPFSELALGMSLCIVLWSVLLNKKEIKPLFFWAKVLIIIIGIYYSHPVALFGIAFTLAYWILKEKVYLEKIIWIFVALIIGLVLYKLYTISIDLYESDQMSYFYKSLELLKEGKSLYPLVIFYRFFYRIYLIPLLLTILSVFVLFVDRKKIEAYFILVSTILLFVVNILLNPDGGSNAMVEKDIWITFLPLAILFPILLKLNKRFSHIPFLLVLFTFIFNVTSVSGEYRERNKRIVEFSLNLKEECGTSKILVNEKLQIDGIGVNWALSEESIILTTLAGNPTTVYVYKTEEELDKIELNNNELFIPAPFALKWWLSEAAKKLFDIPNEKYCVYDASFQRLSEFSFFDDPDVFNNSKRINFKGIDCIQRQVAFKGDYSWTLNSKQPYGVGAEVFSLRKGEVIIVSAWRKGNQGGIVVSGEDSRDFYIYEDFARYGCDGWNKIFIVHEVKNNIDKLIIYTFNPHAESSVFDFMEINIFKIH